MNSDTFIGYLTSVILMAQDRKEFRKSFNSPGQLYVAGELLNFISFDISINGILIEIVPGGLLSNISDFEGLLKENNAAEIYVKDLMLTGEVNIVWARLENEKIKLGLVFREVMNNAEKLWRKRNYYRSSKAFTGYIRVDDKKIEFKGVDMSVTGMAIQLGKSSDVFKLDYIIKLWVNKQDIKGMGKIVWVNALAKDACILGLRFLTID